MCQGSAAVASVALTQAVVVEATYVGGKADRIHRENPSILLCLAVPLNLL